MRLWSIHPRYLDARGLVALWREALLAQAVLRGGTRGYTHHPQLARFRSCSLPEASIAFYLEAVHAESVRRGWRFDGAKIGAVRRAETIPVTRGQMQFEWAHLGRKLKLRDPAWRERIRGLTRPRSHPLFRIVPGPVEVWEAGARHHGSRGTR